MNESIWHLPEPAAVCPVQVAGDTSILLRRHGNPDGLRVLLATGNGFAADMYYPFWSLLEDRFDIMLFDLRNHGWNPVSDRRFHNIYTFADDLLAVSRAVAENFDRRPMVGLFHSLSAFVGMLSISDIVAADTDAPFAGLVLFDPPVLKPGLNQIERDEQSEKIAEMLQRRGSEFDSLLDFTELLHFGGFFRNSVAGTTELVARTLLRWSAEKGKYVLRCPPEYEAQIWRFCTAYLVEENFARSSCPMKIIGSDPTLPFSFMPAVHLETLMSVDYDFIPRSSHLMQLEFPDRCKEIMCAFMSDIGFLDSAFDHTG